MDHVLTFDDLPSSLNSVSVQARSRIRAYVNAHRLITRRAVQQYGQYLGVFDQPFSTDQIPDEGPPSPSTSPDVSEAEDEPELGYKVHQWLKFASSLDLAPVLVEMGCFEMADVLVLAAAMQLGDRMKGLLSLALCLRVGDNAFNDFIFALDEAQAWA
ncbi:hypothetical protein BDZ89DRAFT_1132893 [Hymenopellis radicata]|nr:hypothetical protein BDZ89DRAFT_1132893 [Hymenopellis radicata]